MPTIDNYLNKTEHEKVLVAYLEYMTKVIIIQICIIITSLNLKQFKLTIIIIKKKVKLT